MKSRWTTNNRAPSCPFSWSRQSPTPTLEEVSAWAQSFDKLMLAPAGRNAFREFLRTEFSEDNMLFWMACEELKKEANKSIIEEKARTIYEDYISILSPKEVRTYRKVLFQEPMDKMNPSVCGTVTATPKQEMTLSPIHSAVTPQ